MTCPECGSRRITVEPGADSSPLATAADAVLDADERDTILVARDCWECGWRGTRRLKLTAIEVESGDHSVHQRRRLIDGVRAELADIQRIPSLRDALAEIRRVRQMEPSGPEGVERPISCPAAAISRRSTHQGAENRPLATTAKPPSPIGTERQRPTEPNGETS